MAKTDKTENNKKQRQFWKDFKAELKKVIWPTRSQVVNNTVIVLVIVVIVTALCFVLDFAFEALNTYGIDKLKTVVQGSSNTIENVVVDDSNTTENDITVNETSEVDNLDNSIAE